MQPLGKTDLRRASVEQEHELVVAVARKLFTSHFCIHTHFEIPLNSVGVIISLMRIVSFTNNSHLFCLSSQPRVMDANMQKQNREIEIVFMCTYG